jgi:hypothetical protein
MEKLGNFSAKVTVFSSSLGASIWLQSLALVLVVAATLFVVFSVCFSDYQIVIDRFRSGWVWRRLLLVVIIEVGISLLKIPVFAKIIAGVVVFFAVMLLLIKEAVV